jgi:hypothetical protein
MSVRAVLAAVLATVSLSSCGDSGGQTLRATDFRQEVNAICEEYIAQARALGSPFEGSEEGVLDPLETSTAQRLQTYLTKAIALTEAETAEFEQVHPPSGLEDEWNHVIDLQHEGVAKARELQDALRDKALARIRAALEDQEVSANEGRQAVSGLGLTTCGQS